MGRCVGLEQWEVSQEVTAEQGPGSIQMRTTAQGGRVGRGRGAAWVRNCPCYFWSGAYSSRAHADPSLIPPLGPPESRGPSVIIASPKPRSAPKLLLLPPSQTQSRANQPMSKHPTEPWDYAGTQSNMSGDRALGL